MKRAAKSGPDVLVVGAGILGCAIARECAMARLQVTLVDRGLPSSGATSAAMGHVVVIDDSPALLALTRYGRQLWQEVAPRLPSNVGYASPGTLWIAEREAQIRELHARESVCSSAGVECSVLNGAELAALEPHLRPGLAGALLVADDATLYPQAASSFLLLEAERLGVRCIWNCPVVSAGQGRGILADGSRWAVDAVVLATGCDTTLAPWLPIRKRKGHLVLTGPRPGLAQHQLVELAYHAGAHASTADSVAFNVQPRQNGQLLIGSSRQYGVDDALVDPGIVRAILDRATAYMPILRTVPVLRQWTGFRAATPDALPLLGPILAPTLNADRTVHLALGLEGLGITNAIAAAQLVVDQILGRKPRIDPAPYAPARLWKQVQESSLA